MMPDDDTPLPGALPDLFTHCPRCGGGKAEPYGSLRYGQPCDTCYGLGEVLTEAGQQVAAVMEWRELAHRRRHESSATREMRLVDDGR